MYLDRRVSETLLSELEGGALSWLPAVCRDSERLDLQLRGYPRASAESRATAYVGTTKVLDVYESGGRFRVKASPTARRWGRVSLPWAELGLRQPLETLEPYMDRLCTHTATAAAAVDERWAGNEGRLQTLIARHELPGFTVIDREAIVGFGSRPEEKREHDHVRACFAPVLSPMREEWSEPDAPRSWRKADFLALDADGRLLVIEVKRGGDKRLAWAPAQAAYCAALFGRAAHGGVPLSENIEVMLAQRERLQIVPRQRPRLATPLDVVPVVAVGTPVDASLLTRARGMARALADEKPGCGPVAIWIINPDERSVSIDEYV